MYSYLITKHVITDHGSHTCFLTRTWRAECNGLTKAASKPGGDSGRSPWGRMGCPPECVEEPHSGRPGAKQVGSCLRHRDPPVSKAPSASRHQLPHAHLLPLLLSFIVGGGISTVSQLANFKAQHQTDTSVSAISPRALDGPAHPLDGSQKRWAGRPFGGGWVVTERHPRGSRRQQEHCSSSTAVSRQVALSGPRSPRPPHEGLNTEPRFRAPSACYPPAAGEPRRRDPPSRGGQRHPEALCGGGRPAYPHSTRQQGSGAGAGTATLSSPRARTGQEAGDRSWV